ncbi:nuclear transport factor 2 family protein [Reichenbachiella agariperforans]|uniref:nuclear transport factor 2 family protein n=1 Tax=Reichenbachiella agariperforans TaxID=156994 RepID=UPI001C08A7B6|nr:nuclear transport factor 2 family protein [Reichenbachiella agariperforans]MBU2913987.1 nuclear transport factor 2 family protein [Reichenbachiella agariperforans]
MKTSFLLFASSLLWISCGPNKIRNTNIDTVSSYVQALEDMDYDAMDSLLHADFYMVGPSVGDTVYKDQLLANWKANTGKTIESIRFRHQQISGVAIPSQVKYGDWISEWSLAQIEFKNFDGPPVTLLMSVSYLVVGNQIAKGIMIYDEGDMYNQLGYIFADPVDVARAKEAQLELEENTKDVLEEK